MSDFNAEVKAQFELIDKKVGDALARHDGEVAELGKASKRASQELKDLTSQHAELHAEMKKMGDAMTALEQRGDSGHGSNMENAGIGSQFVASDAFSRFVAGDLNKASATFQNNTIVTGGDNSVTRHEQLNGVVAGAVRQLTVLPTITQGQSSSNIVYYSRELAWTNAAAETAEAAQKPESTLTFEEVQEAIRTVPHIIKVSKQALDDSTFLASYIDNRMSHGVRNKIEQQIINGDGTGVTFNGWLKSGNHVVTSPLLTTDVFGLASKMKYEIIAADYEPSYYYMNPTDWAGAETLRKADKSFLAGNVAVTYVNNGLTPLLWGLPVVLSSNIPAGTIVCKSTMADMYISRSDVNVQMFEQDADNVQKNLVTIRAEARGAEAVMVPAAIRTGSIAGITAP